MRRNVVRTGRHRDPEVDPLEIADVADVLLAAAADDRQDAEVVAIVEHGRKIIGDRQPGGVDIARYDRDRIGIDPLAQGPELRLVRQRNETRPGSLALRTGRRDGNGCGQRYRGQYAIQC